MEETDSGLFIQVLQGGSGPPAGYGDEMGVHYTVWLPNGSKVDSSHDHDPPEPYPLILGSTSLIDGWVEGVTGMRMGERRKLVLPYDLAYGTEGRPPAIPAYSPLVFEVELADHIPAGEG
ncbi:MAG: FKBP-type peptidyl-prolyl cis-trans isomerase [Gemmatimonadales bacterium]|nr:FKBP-type peptidyl-prolyl cis-trans isomerase [Gemmatimonadales bacterium]MYG50187.1 FKBP-type peptidyl-prolyl cis-trans isomerase [Gemmatimonadales bacterium]MYK00477.1 FKBP-type peptidyl-prolyl cis-trans isomerase [Candidatus Palauibacter ramosifaciens]